MLQRQLTAAVAQGEVHSPSNLARLDDPIVGQIEVLSSISLPALSTGSNGLGLSSVKLATMAVGGRAWMEADEQHTTVNLVLVAEKCGEGSEFSPLCGSSPNVIGRSSPGRMMQCPTIHATSSTGSRLSPGVGVTIGSTLRMATPTSRGKVLQPCPLNGSSLVCIGIDDSPTLRRMQVSLIHVRPTLLSDSDSLGRLLVTCVYSSELSFRRMHARGPPTQRERRCFFG